MQPRNQGPWWHDQNGTEWSAYSLWTATIGPNLVLAHRDDENGVQIYERYDGEILYLVRIAPPEASKEGKEQFYREWDEQGEPPD